MHAQWLKEGLISKEQPTPSVAGVADMQGHVTIGSERKFSRWASKALRTRRPYN